jgi:hypothetical protein
MKTLVTMAALVGLFAGFASRATAGEHFAGSYHLCIPQYDGSGAPTDPYCTEEFEGLNARAQAPTSQFQEKSSGQRSQGPCTLQFDGSGAPTGPYCVE